MKTTGRNFVIALAAMLLLLTAEALHGQTTEATLHSLLAQPVEPAAAAALQMEQYLSHRITPAAISQERERLGRPGAAACGSMC
jgi:hypothetical protein